MTGSTVLNKCLPRSSVFHVHAEIQTDKRLHENARIRALVQSAHIQTFCMETFILIRVPYYTFDVKLQTRRTW